MEKDSIINKENLYSANNLSSLPIVISKGKGHWLYDLNGKRYLDMSGALAVNNFGYCHPKLVNAAKEQIDKISMCSRLFYSDKLANFVERLCQLTQLDKALPMNSGAEAFETAVKAVRRWGYMYKNIAQDQAEIIVCNNNFHGRTVTVISASSNEKHKQDFGPFTPGFKFVNFNDIDSLQKAITKNTVGFILEPIQGEGGIVLPNDGYLLQCQKLCRQHNIMLICDEIQTGIGRTGSFLYSEQANIKPDGVLLGKGLGGGIVPISALIGTKELMQVFNPGSHGTTFSGNPLAAAIGSTALEILFTENMLDNVTLMGTYLLQKLKNINSKYIKCVRGCGLLFGIELNTNIIDTTNLCKALAANGLLVINTRNKPMRLAPAFTITKAEIKMAIDIFSMTLETVASQTNKHNVKHGTIETCK